MNETQSWTIKRLLDWTSDYFSSNDSDSPRLDAEVLLAEALDCQRIELYTRFDQEPNDEQKARFRDWVRRHAEGEPVAYLVGHREFYSLKLFVDDGVLIPRPETEHLVSETIELANKLDNRQSIKIIDIGTGSGAVAISLAKHLPTAEIFATDISADALNVAGRNVATHELGSRIELIESDLFNAVPEGEFDFIVSNPPYIGKNEIDSVDDNVRNFEPHVALFAPEEDGLSVIRRLVDEAASRLVTGGCLLFEMSPIISERCQKLLADDDRYENVRIVKDLARLDRILIAQCK